MHQNSVTIVLMSYTYTWCWYQVWYI